MPFSGNTVVMLWQWAALCYWNVSVASVSNYIDYWRRGANGCIWMNEWSEIDRGRKRCVVTHKRSSHVYVSHPQSRHELAVQTSGTAQKHENILLHITHDSGENIGPKIVPILVAAFWGVGVRPLACWDCGFESRRGHGCLSLWGLCVVR
jgi:hypothetical protein